MKYLINIFKCLLCGAVAIPVLGILLLLFVSAAVLLGAFTGKTPRDTITYLESSLFK